MKHSLPTWLFCLLCLGCAFLCGTAITGGWLVIIYCLWPDFPGVEAAFCAVALACAAVVFAAFVTAAVIMRDRERFDHIFMRSR